MNIRKMALAAREAQRALARAGASRRRAALGAIADTIAERGETILAANREDLAALPEATSAFRDRLTLNEKRLAELVASVRMVADLPDPLGEVVREWTRPNGLTIRKVRVPIGLIAVIYESRPNVTIDAAVLCLKAGNAVILRGGKEAIRTNKALAGTLAEGLARAGFPGAAAAFVDSTDRAEVTKLLGLTGIVDLVIPRGGESLIRTVVAEARVPVIYHGKGLCHLYVDAAADPERAEKILVNAKASRPGVCNAIETLLVHEGASGLLPRLARALLEKKVEIRGCPRTLEILRKAGIEARPATDADWDEEYLDYILSIRVVPSLDEAIEHIARHGSGLAEAIVTQDRAAADRFLAEVDASSVYENASTRFTDGGEFGFGAEIGISTQKLHARGPMGPEELTTTKYLVRGTGQVR